MSNSLNVNHIIGIVKLVTKLRWVSFILIFLLSTQDEINTANVDSNSWNQAYLAYIVGGSAVAVVAFILLTVSKLNCIKFEILWHAYHHFVAN